MDRKKRSVQVAQASETPGQRAPVDSGRRTRSLRRGCLNRPAGGRGLLLQNCGLDTVSIVFPQFWERFGTE